MSNVKNYSVQGGTEWTVEGKLNIPGTLASTGSISFKNITVTSTLSNSSGIANFKTVNISSALNANGLITSTGGANFRTITATSINSTGKVNFKTVSITGTVTSTGQNNLRTINASNSITSTGTITGRTVNVEYQLTSLTKITAKGLLELGDTAGSSGKLIDRNGKWDDALAPAYGFKPGPANNPGLVKLTTGATTNGLLGYGFDAGTMEELFFSVQLPHSRKLRTPLGPHVHWIPTTTGAGVVRWGLEYQMAAIGTTFGVNSILYTTSAAVGKKNITADFADISTTGIPTHSAMILCRIFRHANSTKDTYAADAGLMQVDFHFLRDKLGSRTEFGT